MSVRETGKGEVVSSALLAGHWGNIRVCKPLRDEDKVLTATVRFAFSFYHLQHLCKSFLCDLLLSVPKTRPVVCVVLRLVDVDITW